MKLQWENFNKAAMKQGRKRRMMRRQSNENKLYRQYVLRIIAIGKAKRTKNKKSRFNYICIWVWRCWAIVRNCAWCKAKCTGKLWELCGCADSSVSFFPIEIRSTELEYDALYLLYAVCSMLYYLKFIL